MTQENTIKQAQEKNYRWNFTVNLLDGASFWFGSSFISSSTIFPLFISKLTPSLIPIGLLSVIASAGWFLPQLFSARITERSSKMKKFCVGWGIFLERLPIWVLILSALAARQHPVLALILLFLSFTWHTMGSGLIAPSWMALIAKIFPPEKRGSFMGLTMFIGAGAGALGSSLSAWLLVTSEFPNSFIWLFTIAAGFISLSWVFLALTREPEGDIKAHDRDQENYWAAIHRFQVSDASVGLYTLVMMVGQTVGYLVLGRMADRFGHKLSLEIGVLAMALAFALAIFVPSPAVYYVIYALMGIYTSSGIVSGMMVVWEFCDLSRVPTYSGLVNTARGIIGLIGPILATQLASSSFILLFSICTGFILLGLGLLLFWVKEPRWQTKSP